MKEYVYKIEIKGMRCGMCESHINNVIRKNFNVKSVKSSHIKNETVIISKEPLDEAKIKEVVDSTGYIFVNIKSEEREHQSFFKRLFKKK